MAYQPKSYRKFLASSVSAAVVATTVGAVAPVQTETADAAEKFSDVADNYWASGAIQRLADEGIIHGYSDGTYRPGNTIVRGQVAAMLVSAFDLPVDHDVAPPFEDLNRESYFTPYAAAVKEAGFIRGRENNTEFAAGMDLSRQQMASILVRAFNLSPKDGADVDVADLYEANDSHRESIEVLAQYNITDTSDGRFRPKETVTRAQFATFLDRALQLQENEEGYLDKAVAVDDTTVEVSFNGQLLYANEEDFTFDPELEVTHAEIITPEESEASENAVGNVVRLTTEEREANQSYELTYRDETVDVSDPSLAFVVGDVTVDSTTSFNVELEDKVGKDVEEDDVREALEVALYEGEDEEEADIDITDISINKDRDVITVEHADDDLEGTAGTLVVNGFEYEFDYETLDVESVEATTTSIRDEDDQELGFTVNGFRTPSLDRLEDEGYEVEFLFSESGGVFDDAKDTGVIDASDLTESFRYAVEITDEDGNEFTSEEQTVSLHGETEAEKISEVAFFLDDEQWDNDYVTTAQAGAKIQAIEATNAFGEELDEDALEDLVLESVTSSDLSAAYYDSEDGLQVVGEGTTTFEVSFEGVEDPVEFEVEVVEDQEINDLQEADTTQHYTLNATEDTFTVLDQYGEPFGDESEVSYTIEDEDGDVVEEGSVTVDPDGKLQINFPEDLEAGEYTLEVSDSGDELGTVTLEFLELNAEEVDEFTLSADPDSVDLEDALNQDGGIDYDANDLRFDITTGAEYEDVTLDSEELTAALDSVDGDLQLRTSDESVASLADDDEVDELDVSTDEVVDGLEAYGRSEGTATIYLEEVEGDFVTTLAQVQVEVESSIPQIDELTLADDADVLEIVEHEDGDAWSIPEESFDQLTSPEVDNVDATMIDEVIYSENDEKALIRLTDVYGGKSFQVDAEVTE